MALPVAVPVPVPVSIDVDATADAPVDMALDVSVDSPAMPAAPQTAPGASEDRLRTGSGHVGRLRGAVRSAESEEEDAMLTDEEPSPSAPTAPALPRAEEGPTAISFNIESPQAMTAAGLDPALRDRITGHIAEALMRTSHKPIGALCAEMGARGIKTSYAEVRAVLAHMEAREVVMVDGGDVFRI